MNKMSGLSQKIEEVLYIKRACIKKTRPARVRPPPRYCIKKENFSHTGRENSRTPIPPKPQRRRATCEIRMTSDLEGHIVLSTAYTCVRWE
jgi:hypothetical protein